MMEQKKKRNDVILILLLLAVSAGAWLGVSVYQSRSTVNGIVKITIDGEKAASYSLSEDREERFDFGDGEYNILVVQNGEARITEASCPDQICVKHRAINKNHQSIACLPHELLVEIENGEENEVDGVSN